MLKNAVASLFRKLSPFEIKKNKFPKLTHFPEPPKITQWSKNYCCCKIWDASQEAGNVVLRNAVFCFRDFTVFTLLFCYNVQILGFNFTPVPLCLSSRTVRFTKNSTKFYIHRGWPYYSLVKFAYCHQIAQYFPLWEHTALLSKQVCTLSLNSRIFFPMEAHCIIVQTSLHTVIK